MTEYKYYKIIRKYDGFTTYCNVLNFIESHFKRIFGTPTRWIESDEKATLRLRKDEIIIPLKIEVTANDCDFDIVLSEQEYKQVNLKCL